MGLKAGARKRENVKDGDVVALTIQIRETERIESLPGIIHS